MTTTVRWISLLARLGLVAVWFYAGFAKAFNPVESVTAVAAYELFPPGLNQIVGWGLPWFEIALGLLLLVGLATRPTAVISAVVLIVFIAGIVSAWARGLSIDCGCFGPGGQVEVGQANYLEAIVRDLGFCLMAGWLIWKPHSPFSVDNYLLHPEPIEESK